jgi:hypothetical protein
LAELAPPVAEAIPRARARRRNIEGEAEEEDSSSFEVARVETPGERVDRRAAAGAALLWAASLLLRDAIRDGVLLVDATKQRVIV